MPEEVRVAAVEGARLVPGDAQPGTRAIDRVGRGKPSSNSVAEAAVRDDGPASRRARPTGRSLTASSDYPLGLRREALRTLAQLQDGGSQVLELARAGKLPDGPEERGDDAAAHRSPTAGFASRRPRSCRCPRRPAASRLPPIGELIRRRRRCRKGPAVFFRAGTNSCAGCHRVQGAASGSGPTSRRSASSTAATS